MTVAAQPPRLADPLCDRDHEPLRTADVGLLPHALVLPDATDQAITEPGGRVDGCLDVVDLEADVAQPELGGYGVGRPRRVVGVHEPRQLQPGTAAREVETDDLGPGARDAA